MRTTRRGGVRGYDAGKKILGRKRHLLVDTDGLILKVRVHAADVQDRDGATPVLDQIDEPLSKLELIWADGGHAGDKLACWMEQRFGERPFGWLGNFRRLSKDYEFRADSSEAFIFLAASLLLLTRLAKP